MSRLVRIVAALAVTATSLFTIDPFTIGAAATTVSAGSSSAFVAQINSLRAARGLPALAVNGSLNGVAQNWAAHMAATGALAHNAALGSQVPAGWRYIEENVGMGSNDAIIEATFAASPDHYGNIVNRGVTEVGVGVASAGAYLWVVEDFWGGASAPAPSPPPAPWPGPGPSPGQSPGSGAHSPAPSVPSGSGANGAAATGGSSGQARGWWQLPGGARGGAGRGGAQQPAPSGTAPGGGGQVANLNTVANQVQYLDTFD